MDFEAVARRPDFKAHQEKNCNFATNVWYPGSHSGCISIVAKNFPDRSRFTRSLLQIKRDGPDVWMLV